MRAVRRDSLGYLPLHRSRVGWLRPTPPGNTTTSARRRHVVRRDDQRLQGGRRRVVAGVGIGPSTVGAACAGAPGGRSAGNRPPSVWSPMSGSRSSHADDAHEEPDDDGEDPEHRALALLGRAGIRRLRPVDHRRRQPVALGQRHAFPRGPGRRPRPTAPWRRSTGCRSSNACVLGVQKSGYQPAGAGGAGSCSMPPSLHRPRLPAGPAVGSSR